MPSVGLVCAAIAIVVGCAIASAVLIRRRRRLWAVAATVLTLALAAGVTVEVSTAAERTAAVPRATSNAQRIIRVDPPAATWTPVDIHRGPGYAHIPRLRVPVFPASLHTSTVRTAATLPAHGTVGSVIIPALRSHFVARPAIVYLPPAALTPQPRLLPVIIAFPGQSRGAGPTDLVWKGLLPHMMDAIAAKHGGVAPIVVVPDQLGPATGNPMCVDSKHFGHVATYVMQDVRRWILGHLPVAIGRRQWTIAGFSEGGTCAIQFGAAHPDVFGSLVDISGENAPSLGTLTRTIALGFAGNRTAYLHATPAWILAHRHDSDMQAYFAAGSLDHRYGPVAPVMEARARHAGMTTHRLVVPHLAHYWKTATAGLTWAFGQLVGWWDI